MITIYLNNRSINLNKDTSLLQLLVQEKCLEQDMAIAVNNEFISRKYYEHTALLPGDRIDVLVPMQGG